MPRTGVALGGGYSTTARKGSLTFPIESSPTEKRRLVEFYAYVIHAQWTYIVVVYVRTTLPCAHCIEDLYKQYGQC